MFGFGRSCLVAAVLVFGAASCRPAPGPPGSEVLELRSYEVPEGYSRELEILVNRALDGGEGNADKGRALQGPGGELILVATPQIHRGVGEMLGKLELAPAQPPRNIWCSYYVVLGRPMTAEASDVPDSRLSSITKALDAIRLADGPQFFELWDSRSLLSVDGQTAVIDGRSLRVRQTASYSPENETIQLELGVASGLGNIDTQVQLVPDQLLVLGRNAGTSDGQNTSSYVIVKAEIVDQAP